MKKILYSASVVLFLTLTGFTGCHHFFDFFGNNFYGVANVQVETTDQTVISYGIIAGENGKICTRTGRPPAQWVERPSGTTQQLNAVKMGMPISLDGAVDSTVAYAVGNNSAVLRSTDKGHTWQNRSIPGEYSDLYGIDIINYPPGTGVNAIVCGDSGLVYRSSNSGSNFVWLYYNIGAVRKLNSIAAVNHFVWAVVGDNGTIYRTISGGETWQNKSISSSISLKKVVTPRYDRYCCVGTGGAIYTSTDYGNSWVPRTSGTTVTLRDVYFVTPDSGFAAGDNGVVRYTTNGGVSWQSDSYLSGLTTRNILNIFKVDENTYSSLTSSSTPDNPGADTSYFLSVSSEPFIGIEPISNFIADIFSLKQNYPNPFNPVTNIEISVPQNSLVKLIIYDVQGKEVEILVNRELNRGSYKIDWNAANYPSGVYFYRIITEGFSETRKMILIK